MANDDSLRPDQNLFDDEAKNLLALLDRRGFGRVLQTTDETLEVFGQLEIALLIEKAGLQSIELGSHTRLLLAQIGHPPAKLLQ